MYKRGISAPLGTIQLCPALLWKYYDMMEGSTRPADAIDLSPSFRVARAHLSEAMVNSMWRRVQDRIPAGQCTGDNGAGPSVMRYTERPCIIRQQLYLSSASCENNRATLEEIGATHVLQVCGVMCCVPSEAITGDLASRYYATGSP